jgi:thiamine pyrophosphokinase
MAEKKAWLFVNGPVGDSRRLQALISSGDWIVAVDGGYTHLKAAGIKPELVIGDLDSLSETDLKEILQAKIPLQRFPTDKDETDLELAVNAALDRGCKSIRFVGAFGGRLDMSVGNLTLLLRPDLTDLDVRLEDGETEAWLVRVEGRVVGQTGDIVSLLPVNGPASGVTTSGLHYPLRAESLSNFRTRGISNVMEGSEARIELRDGVLLVIHIRKSNQ